MPSYQNVESDFLDKVVSIIEENLSDEDFGVSELSESVGMSRSNLLRRVQKLTDLSVSVLIRQVRLNHAQQFLQTDSYNVSEVCYKVGFSSLSYFIKCYKDEFGYSPGEEVKKNSIRKGKAKHKDLLVRKLGISALMVTITLLSVFGFYSVSRTNATTVPEKSIAVLPFINDSNDSANVYIINGLMEAILNNLQKIEDLRVVSRSSVETYRESPKSATEIADELDVSYIIEGSGQKVGNQLMLTVQLIEAKKDDHLWSEMYERSALDIFALQIEVAKDIAREAAVLITPEEEKLIRKIPTDNLKAYDLYMRGLDLVNNWSLDYFEEAIKLFKQSIQEDPEFAHSYAYIASCFFFLDRWQNPKKFGDSINWYSDRALFFDSELDHSLIAKGLFYMHDAQHQRAAEYFERAYEVNPNSTRAILYLSVIYSRFLRDTEKYVLFALRGSKIEVAIEDSTTNSSIHLHIAEALTQAGFLEEAQHHINLSLGYDPDDLYAQYVAAQINLARNNKYLEARNSLIKTHRKDSLRLDLLSGLGNICYLMKDYASANHYYSRFLALKKDFELDFFNSEYGKIGYVLRKSSNEKEASKCINRFHQFALQDGSIYKNLYLASYYAIIGEVDAGIQALNEFLGQEKVDYWSVRMLREDPIILLLRSHSKYESIVEKIEAKFWYNHKGIRQKIEQENLL